MANFKTVVLSELCYFVKDKVKVNKLNLINYVSTENMLPNKNGITTASNLPTTTHAQLFKRDDILVSNIRPYFKKIWKAEFDGGCSTDVLVFRANYTVDANFLYYVLSDDHFFNYATFTSKGTKMPRGDKVAIMNYQAPLVDITLQKRIASCLKTLDEKIKLNNKINNNLAA